MPDNKERVKKTSKRSKVISTNSKNDDIKKTLQGCDPDDLIFALDIGTRTVVGIVGIPDGERLKIISTEVVEHRSRAMLDGQIHDISQVADVANEVKTRLEKNIGFKLAKVAVAAAGRVLRTCGVRIERDIDSNREIDQELVSSIEIEAIQTAQLKLDNEMEQEEKVQFYCVGHSVINYYLNGYVISKLVGHKGKKIGVDILATFLPHIVVDSLYTVMSRIGLEVISLTLEPIAAINVTIPKDLRLLNLALVDIGAGTSDIALTRDGSVVAYAMAPIAGDEITEKIAQHYLVDFNTGEKIKTCLSGTSDKISFTDILGKKHSVGKNEVLEVIRPSIELLAETIAQKILEYNQKAPNAIFLIGGGSQIPCLTDIIADYMKLSRERVVVRGRDIIQNIRIRGRKLSGPEAVTPFGIAVTAQMNMGKDFLSVTVNGRKVRLFNSKRLTVADALVLIGFNPSQLIGRTGKSITFEMNGIKKIVRGEYGKAAEIFINDMPANLETIIKPGDNIRVIASEDGKNAEAKLSDFLKDTSVKNISFNGKVYDISARAYINGKSAHIDSNINNGDSVIIESVATLSDLLKLHEIDTGMFAVTVNGKEVDGQYLLKNQDIVECNKLEVKAAAPVEEKVQPENSEQNEETENTEKSPENGTSDTEVLNIQQNKSSTAKKFIIVTVNNRQINLSAEKQHMFVDIFNYIDFDLTSPKGNIVLRLNGKQAAFTDMITNGDVIDIYWG